MKNESTRKVINVDKPNYVPLFEFKELDNAVIRLSLFKASVEFDITGQTVKLGAKTSKGLKEQSEGFTINKNNLDIDLKNSILVPGTVEIDLELKDASGTMTTASFFITVKSKVLNDKAVEGTNEFDTFTKTAAKIEEDYKGLRRIIIDENQAANLQDQVNQTNAQLETITNQTGLESNLDKFKKMVIESKNNQLNNVTYICVGDSTRAAYGQIIYKTIQNILEPCNVKCFLVAKSGMKAEEFYNETSSPKVSDIWGANPYTWDLIPGDGSTTLIDICLCINDMSQHTIEEVKGYLTGIANKLLAQKPNVLINFTSPNKVSSIDKTSNLNKVYQEIAKLNKYSFIDVLNNCFNVKEDINTMVPDGTHPSEETQYKMANYIISRLLNDDILRDSNVTIRGEISDNHIVAKSIDYIYVRKEKFFDNLYIKKTAENKFYIISEDDSTVYSNALTTNETNLSLKNIYKNGIYRLYTGSVPSVGGEWNPNLEIVLKVKDYVLLNTIPLNKKILLKNVIVADDIKFLNYIDTEIRVLKGKIASTDDDYAVLKDSKLRLEVLQNVDISALYIRKTSGKWYLCNIKNGSGNIAEIKMIVGEQPIIPFDWQSVKPVGFISISDVTPLVNYTTDKWIDIENGIVSTITPKKSMANVIKDLVDSNY